MVRRTLLTLAVAAVAFITVGSLMAADESSVVGTVTAVSQDEMTIRTDDDTSWTFKLNDQTQRLPGVVVGDRVQVAYRDTVGTDTALNVTRPGTTNAMTDNRYSNDTTSDSAHLTSVRGSVVSATPTEVTILTDAGERKTFTLTSGMDRTYLTAGTRVRIDYDGSGGQMIVRSVAPADSTATETARYSSSNLPNTASALPLVMLSGLLSLVTGSALWFGRKQLW